MGQLNNILLIEDDQITNFINQRLLKKVDASYKVTIAQNGLEGIQYIKNCLANNISLPQLIFLDINMPVMNGFEFLEAFQRLLLDEKIVIIMLTTSSHIHDMGKLFASGNSHIVSKPLTESKVISILEQYFDDRVQLSQMA